MTGSSSAKKIWNSLGRIIRRGYEIGYRECYAAGIQTIRLSRYGKRRLARLFRPLQKKGRSAADWLVTRHVRKLCAGCAGVKRCFSEAKRRLTAAWRRHPLLAGLQALALPFLALRHYRRVVKGFLNLAAPAAAVLVLVFTVQYWSTRTFGLVLEVDGETIGAIADESVYENASTMAAQRVIDTDESFHLERSAKLTLAVVPQDGMLDETTLCDEILRSAGSSISQASGLYVDGVFEGAVESGAALQEVLDSILFSHAKGAENIRAEFLSPTEVVEGLYPVSTLLTAEEMRERLTRPAVVEKTVEVQAGDTLGAIARRNDMTLDELCALNSSLEDIHKLKIGQQLTVQRAQPYLQVRVIRQYTYTEAMAFDTKKVQDATKYVGYEAIRTKGQEGSRQVVAEEVLIDGIRESTKVLSTSVIKQPVTQVKVVGTKKYPTGKSGMFIWPVPGFYQIYSPFGWRGSKLHKGIDISQANINGQTIVASAAGRVVEANSTSRWGVGTGAGYGYYVVIEHAGGYRTRYAHCQSINVKVGDTVYQGQPIARVGSTGDSRGPHLHFEITLNGSYKNPASYVKK